VFSCAVSFFYFLLSSSRAMDKLHIVLLKEWDVACDGARIIVEVVKNQIKTVHTI